MKKFHAILLVLGVAFLAYLVWTTGWDELRHELTALGWGLIPLILCEGVGEMFHTMGWCHCLSGPHRLMPFPLLFGMRMSGYAINYLTPTATLAGEVTKTSLLARKHRGPEAVSGVLIDKVCFALAHLLFVSVGAIFIAWFIKLRWVLWAGLLFSGVVVGSGMLIFLLLQKYGKLGAIIRWLAVRKMGGHALQKAAEEFTAVDEALKVFYRERPLDLALSVGWHLLGYSVGIAQAWIFFGLLKQTASLTVAAGTWFLSMWFDLVTFTVPMNLGTLEGSRIVVLKAMGYDALLGMTYGMTLRLAQLCWSAFGLASYALLVWHAGTPLPNLSVALRCADGRQSQSKPNRNTPTRRCSRHPSSPGTIHQGP